MCRRMPQFAPNLVRRFLFVLNALMAISSGVLNVQSTGHDSKADLYKTLVEQLRSLIGSESDWIANLANAGALIFQSLPDVNWAGFYLLKGD